MPVFPWSMSDFKPGEGIFGVDCLYKRAADLCGFSAGSACAFGVAGTDGFAPTFFMTSPRDGLRRFRFFIRVAGNTRQGVRK